MNPLKAATALLGIQGSWSAVQFEPAGDDKEISTLHEFLVSAIAFVVLMEIMVLVHEFGHFAAASLFGVSIESFSLGFGPRLFGIRRGGTDFKVCLLPLGGFVKMTARNLREQTVQTPGAYAAHPRWQRILIGLAGPAANFLLAFSAMTFYYACINEVPAYDLQTRVIEWVLPGSAADQAGLLPGDILRRFDGQDDPGWDQVYARMIQEPTQSVPLTVERAGKTVDLSLVVPGDLNGDLAGMLPQFLPGPIGVAGVPPGSPAAQAGIKQGDSIVQVDGHPFHAMSTLHSYLQAGQGKPLSLVVFRNSAALGPTVAHPARLQEEWSLGFDFSPIPLRSAPLPLGKALARSSRFCTEASTLIVRMLRQIATHKVSVNELAGPIGIARMAGAAAQMKEWFSKFSLAGEISLNLGIVNLLPFPMLDGWLIFMLLIESVMGRDINRAVKERTYQAGLAVLLIFFAFIMFSDITRLPMFNSTGR
jgi:regulator of sigma E protease